MRGASVAAIALLVIAGGCGAPDPEDVPDPRPIPTPSMPEAEAIELIALATEVGDDDLAEYLARRRLAAATDPAPIAARQADVVAILLDGRRLDEAGVLLDQVELDSAADAALRSRCAALRDRLAAATEIPAPTAIEQESALRALLAQQDERREARAAIRTRLELAELLNESGRPKEALPLVEQAVVDAERELTGLRPRLARVPALIALARLRMSAGDRNAARDRFEQASALRLDAAPESAWLHAEVELAYAEFMVIDGRALEAHDTSRRAVRRLRETFGDDTERTRDAIRRAAAADVLPDHDHP